jgi:Flp pilus assembly protein TadG
MIEGSGGDRAVHKQRGPIKRWRIARRGLLRAVAASRSGSAIVEFAVVLPVLVTLLFGTFEFGRVLWIMNALHYSVQQAARCAAVNATLCDNASDIQAYAAGLAGAGIPSSAFSYSATTCGSVNGNLVSASYTVPLFIPYFSLNPTLTAQSCFPK